MPFPPKPLLEDLSYFRLLAARVKPYLADINLTFEGYAQTIQDYKNFVEEDIQGAWELAQQLNAWTEYFSGLLHLVESEYLDAETNKTILHSRYSSVLSPEKVAAGNRAANLVQEVIDARKKRNCLLAFKNELEAKIKFLERAHYFCKSSWEKGKDVVGVAEHFNRKTGLKNVG